MKQKLLACVLTVGLFFAPKIIFADDASTTPEIIPEEIATTTEITISTPSLVIENVEATTTESVATSTDTLRKETVTTPSSSIENTEATTTESETASADVVRAEIISPADISAPDEVPPGTYISGNLDENQTWTKENGPYYISDIYIPSGVTVTVEAGTEIFVSGYIAVFGNFVLNGSESQKVSMDINSDASGWYIYVDSFANLNLSNVSIKHVDGISTYNGFMNFNNVDYSDATDGIMLNHFGSLVAHNLHMGGGDFGSEIMATDNSSITLENSVIDNGNGGNRYMVQGYRGCKVNIINTQIITSSATPFIMVGGVLGLDGVFMSGGDSNAVELYPENSSSGSVSPKATITNTTIHNFTQDGIFAVNPEIVMANSKIIENDTGIEFYVTGNSHVSVSNSTIMGNLSGIVFGISNEGGDIELDVRNNFWGDKSGPLLEGKNDNTLGDEIVTYTEFAKNKIQFSPWLPKEPGKKNPVIIIPGIMGSYLNKDDEGKTEVWPRVKTIVGLPFDASILDNLLLPSSGKLSASNNILTTGTIKNIYSSDFFDGLIDQLKQNGYEEGKDLFVFPYDWRLDVTDNVNGAANSKVESLTYKIDQILKDTKSDKVDIVAHSMGGLLAKYYIKHVGGEKVDRFIDIGTPHLGAPKAGKVLQYGDDMGMKINNFFGLNLDEIKKISQNFPSAYNLLPSKNYFDSSAADYMYYLYDLGDVDGDGVMGRLSYNNTKAFLENTGRNDVLIQNAESVHDDLDNFNPGDFGIKSFNIVGCGTPTIGKIFVNKKQFDGDYTYQLKYITGDGTVPERSAEGMATDKLFYATGVEHATMPSQNGVRDLVASILKDDEGDYVLDSNVYTDNSHCTIPDGKIISIHSPIALNIYDDSGHHTGPDENGNIEYGIDGITYDILDGNKFAFIPDTLKYTIKFNATGVGTAGIDVQSYKNGEIVKSESFKNIPVSSMNTNGKIIPRVDESQVLIDQTGSEVFETLHPNLSVDGDLPDEVQDNIVTPAPIIRVSISSGSQIATTSLNIQTFKYLNSELAEKDKVIDIQKTNGKNKIKKSASTTMVQGVKLDNNTYSQLASPEGFFENIVDIVWNFIVEIFNKIINLIKKNEN